MKSGVNTARTENRLSEQGCCLGMMANGTKSTIAQTAVQRWMVMGMYNCEKCVHEELCDQPSRQLWGHLTKETDCSDFKDRTNYVEVVRCKDCKHYYHSVSSGKDGRCVIFGSYDTDPSVYLTDFCSYGERRNE